MFSSLKRWQKHFKIRVLDQGSTTCKTLPLSLSLSPSQLTQPTNTAFFHDFEEILPFVSNQDLLLYVIRCPDRLGIAHPIIIHKQLSVSVNYFLISLTEFYPSRNTQGGCTIDQYSYITVKEQKEIHEIYPNPQSHPPSMQLQIHKLG